MAEKPTSKPFAVGDSATTAHIREAMARADLKRVEAELRDKGLIPLPKTLPAQPPTRKR